MKALGWTPTEGSDWTLAWTLDHPEADTFAAAHAGRWVNHLRGINALVIKSQLCVTLRDAAARAKAAGAGALYRFAPQTFVLPAEWDAWQQARQWEPDAVWIQKPADLSRGRGVELVTNPRDVSNRSLIVQRYIANPHLLDGYKYSLRFYVAIVSTDPLIAYVFDGGFTKFASRPFSLDPADLSDRFRHLTNPDILRDDPEATGVSTRNTTHHTYRARLASMGLDAEKLWRDIRRVLAATVAAALPRLRGAESAFNGSGRGQFELLGIDVTVDAQLRPWLLECNLSPSLSVEASDETDASREESDIKTRVIADTLQLVGADTLEESRPAPSTADEARASLTWHDARRGGFERLWPSNAALESLAGSDLSGLDITLLDDHLAASKTSFAPNHVDAIPCGRDTILVDRRSNRVSLLDSSESKAWHAGKGLNWLQDGWLVAPECADPLEPSGPLAPRERRRWNRDRVYNVRGLRVLVACASPVMAEHIDRALSWYEADHLDEVDASLFVQRHEPLVDVLARIDRLALKKAGGLVRRRLIVSGTAESCSLIVSGAGDQSSYRHVTIGGNPIGAWIDTESGTQRITVGAIVASRPTPGDALLDLVSDGPGVVRAYDADSVRALAQWLEAMPIVSAG